MSRIHPTSPKFGRGEGGGQPAVVESGCPHFKPGVATVQGDHLATLGRPSAAAGVEAEHLATFGSTPGPDDRNLLATFDMMPSSPVSSGLMSGKSLATLRRPTAAGKDGHRTGFSFPSGNLKPFLTPTLRRSTGSRHIGQQLTGSTRRTGSKRIVYEENIDPQRYSKVIYFSLFS